MKELTVLPDPLLLLIQDSNQHFQVELGGLSGWHLQPSPCPRKHWPARIYLFNDGLSCHVANSVGTVAATSVFIRADPKDHSGPGPQ